MHDTIALVGRAPGTRHWIARLPEDVPIYSIAACWNIIPREMTACVEIHYQWWFSHPRYAPKMYEWMQQPHPFPIYTQEVYTDVPSSVAYPFADVLALANVKRCAGADWQETINQYFTSSYDYLIGLAILHNPRRIISVGYDMASDTEYRYQREGGAFWLGVAAGRGIEVVIPEECPMLRGMLYGYGGAQAIRRERIERLRIQALAWCDKAQENMRIAAEALPDDHATRTTEPEIRALYEDMGRARDELFLMDGVRQAVDQLLERFTMSDIVTRQELETQTAVANTQYVKLGSMLNFWEGVLKDRAQRLDHNRHDPGNERAFTSELADAQEQLIRTRSEFMVWKGGVQTLRMLVDECDMLYRPDWKPTTFLASVSVVDGVEVVTT